MKTIINIIKWPFKFFFKGSRNGKILILILLAGLVFWRVQAMRNGGLEVETVTISKGKLVEEINAPGEVKADNSANISFQTTGEVEEVNFVEGQEVKVY